MLKSWGGIWQNSQQKGMRNEQNLVNHSVNLSKEGGLQNQICVFSWKEMQTMHVKTTVSSPSIEY